MHRLVARVVASRVVSHSARRTTALVCYGSAHTPSYTAIRAFNTSKDDGEGFKALKRAKDLINADKMDPAMANLSVAAYHDIAEAQYLLGTLLLNEDDDDDDEDEVTEGTDTVAHRELIQDAEMNRQRWNHADAPHDIKTIRKQARKAYKEYLASKNSKKNQQKNTGKDPLVQHASVGELNRAFGTTLKQFLDPKVKIQPLAERSQSTSNAVDTTQAVEWIRRAAENNHRDAHVHLGNLCLSHEPPMAHAAAEWYARVTSAKDPNPHPDALYNLGQMLYDGVEDADPPFPGSKVASIPYFVKAAEAGDESAQFFMGYLLHQGDDELGIETNLTSALMLLEMAAGQGHTGALFYLAQLYRSGDPDHNLEPDREKFLKYLNESLEGGDDDALFCMADIYFHGSDGFPKDLDQARQFYLAAAQAGNADAFCCLGTIYYNGVGVKQDYKKAFLYYQEAADRHSMEAWKNLAEMYSFGRGVPRNEATAQSILKMLENNVPQEEE